jgi:hypothetical protein
MAKSEHKTYDSVEEIRAAVKSGELAAGGSLSFPAPVTPAGHRHWHAVFSHLVAMAHNASRALNSPSWLTSAIKDAEKELAAWK